MDRETSFPNISKARVITPHGVCTPHYGGLNDHGAICWPRRLCKVYFEIWDVYERCNSTAALDMGSDDGNGFIGNNLRWAGVSTEDNHFSWSYNMHRSCKLNGRPRVDPCKRNPKNEIAACRNATREVCLPYNRTVA